MKSLLVYYDPELTTKLEELPIPSYGENEILIKVEVAGSNPKDWKHPMPNYFNSKINQGDDCSGTVAGIGPGVYGFEKGDRVAGFHQMRTPRGTYAEYSVCPANTVFHIPKDMSFEDAATIPLCAYTAAVGLYRNLNLPLPFSRPDLNPIPLIINGAGGAVGAYALQFAKTNPSISPVIAIAGSNAQFAKDLGADIIADYRSPTIADDLAKALKDVKNADKVRVLDATNTDSSVKYLSSVIDSKLGRYTCTSKITPTQKPILDQWGGWAEQIWVGSVHEDNPAGGFLFGTVMSKVIERMLALGQFKGQPIEIIEGGLNGVGTALVRLRDRKGGNSKYVTRIADTK